MCCGFLHTTLLLVCCCCLLLVTPIAIASGDADDKERVKSSSSWARSSNKKPDNFVGNRAKLIQSKALKAQKGSSLGIIDVPAHKRTQEQVKRKSVQEVQKQLQQYWGGRGHEDLEAKAIDFDTRLGNAHVRLIQKVHGLEVEGASLMVHIAPNGTLTAINGEFLLDDQAEELLAKAWGSNPIYYPQDLLELAASEAGIENGSWKGRPQRAVVRRSDDGSLCLAWKRLIKYDVIIQEGTSGVITPKLDMIFADSTYSATLVADSKSQPESSSSNHNIFGRNKYSNRFLDLKPDEPFDGSPSSSSSSTTGALCARHPQYHGSGVPNIETYDCNQTIESCNSVSNSPNRINTGETAVDAAHNYTIAAYNFFYNNFGRDSIDGMGKKVRSFVNYDQNYSNAYWGGNDLVYGGGDGKNFLEFSLGADIVAHEYTHGLTHYTSQLVYTGESGALNEAISDIFGALVDRQEGATGTAIWIVGEDVVISGEGFRNMADPAQFKAFDFYPTSFRNPALDDSVHTNSGIANLAFYLLVMGGTHPRGKTNNVVQAIGFEAAAEIFYNANVNCLTSDATFEMARFCTSEFGGSYTENVHQAWDAVGVPGPGSTPQVTIPLALNEPLSGQNSANIIFYRINIPTGFDGIVRCTTSTTTGDADLYMRFSDYPVVAPDVDMNDCSSFKDGLDESCSAFSNNPNVTDLFVSAHAYIAYTDLTITCTKEPPPPLEFDVPLSGQATSRYLLYRIDSILEGDYVQCETGSSASDGDADLYLRFGASPAVFPNQHINDCSSYSATSSDENCIAGPAESDETLYIMVHAFRPSLYGDVTDLTIQCSLHSRLPQPTISQHPSQVPSFGPTVTVAPSSIPTDLPTTTNLPSQRPSLRPTQTPTMNPTKAPSEAPTKAPSEAPTKVPTQAPTRPPTSVPTNESPSNESPLTPLMSSLGINGLSSLNAGSESECIFEDHPCGGVYTGYLLHKINDNTGECQDRCSYFVAIKVQQGWECGPCV